MTKSKKYVVLVTYIIALVCLLLGLFLPLYNGDSILAFMLPSALGNVAGIDIDIGTAFTNTDSMSLFGLVDLDVASLFIVLYALVTLVGLFLLIPSFLSKEGEATRGCAAAIEVSAVIVLLFVLINSLGYPANAAADILDLLPILIAIGGTFVMLVIQAIAAEGGSGVLKAFMALLGIIAVLAALDLTVLSFYSFDLGSIGVLFAEGSNGTVTGMETLRYMIEETIPSFDAYVMGSGTAAMIASICAALAVLLAIINVGIDLIVTGTHSGKGALVFDCVRYALEFLFAILTLILLFTVDGATPGLLLVVIAALAFIMAVISIVRAIVFRKEEDEEYEEEYDGEEADEDNEEDKGAVIMKSDEEEEPEPKEEESYEGGQVHYREREPYNGPSDGFIERLTESEQKEFAKIFIDKIYGPYDNIPDYVVGGDNKDFFNAVFAYLGKFRPIVSDGLMNKLYSELNLLN